MQLITDEIRQALIENWRKGDMQDGGHDPKPVVKFFTPDGSATWLISEMVEHDEDILFGLCDLGQGFPELGYVAVSEIQSARGSLGLPVERDLHFEPKHTLREYARLAIEAGRIVT